MDETKERNGSKQQAESLLPKAEPAALSAEELKSAQSRARTFTSGATGVALGVLVLIFSRIFASALADGSFEKQDRYSNVFLFVGVLILISAVSQIANAYLAGRFARPPTPKLIFVGTGPANDSPDEDGHDKLLGDSPAAKLSLSVEALSPEEEEK